MSDFQYDSFIIKDSEFPPKGDEFHTKHDLSYKDRVAAWQVIEDAKSLEERLEDSRKTAYEAVDDFIHECRNSPHSTLEREILRGRAIQGLIYCRDNKNKPFIDRLLAQYFDLLDSVSPVSPPSKTYYDHLEDGVDNMMSSMDKILMTQVQEKLHEQ